jgi:hypothetical protein
MPTYTLTLIDTRRVQQYIFGANELKQITGASELVEQATDRFVRDALQDTCGASYYFPPPDRADNSPRQIEKDGLRAEVIFAGGGNVAIVFASHAEAVAFTQRYTTRLWLDAPGLEAAVGHVDFDWDQPQSLARAWDKMHQEVMPRRKDGATFPQAVSGLGVTAQCAYTGGPAVEEAGDEQGAQVLISAEVAAKRQYDAANHRRLTELLPVSGYEYPTRFDDLGGEAGRANFIAVVHADGNNMGKRLKKWSEEGKNNRDFVNRLRAFSQSVNAQGLKALQAVCNLLASHIERNDGEREYIVDVFDKGHPGEVTSDRRIRLKEHRLPLRPIVFGGDDVTLVCDGRLGLTLAAQFLQAFDDEPLIDGEPAFACAGVAIVHTHFPFAQAYDLADKLCKAAKQEARQAVGDSPEAGASLINWHFATSGLLSSWEDIRTREYRQGKLIMRPLLVAAQNASFEQWRSWATFDFLIDQFRREEWRERRNKLKALRTALRDGEEAVREFTRVHGDLPEVLGLSADEARKTGWYGGRCVYFDAVEADDLFTCLKRGA